MSKGIIKDVKIQFKEWEKILIHIFYEGIISKIHKELLERYYKRQPYKKWAKNQNTHFSQEDIQSGQQAHEDIHHLWALRKLKTTHFLHSLGWL